MLYAPRRRKTHTEHNRKNKKKRNTKKYIKGKEEKRKIDDAVVVKICSCIS